MTVAITGASGHLGRKVADLLLERLEPSQVILLTRTPDALASYWSAVSSSVTRTSTSLPRSPNLLERSVEQLGRAQLLEHALGRRHHLTFVVLSTDGGVSLSLSERS